MIITAELSLYPLKDDFEETVISFIKELKHQEGITVHTHSMSTFIRGASGDVFHALQCAFEAAGASSDTVSLVVKIINRPLYPEKTHLEF